MTKQEKHKLRVELGNILDENCATCEKRKRAIKGCRNDHAMAAHRFQQHCIQDCPVGIKMQMIGKMLLQSDDKKTVRQVTPRIKSRCSKCRYLSVKTAAELVSCKKCGAPMINRGRKTGRPGKKLV